MVRMVSSMGRGHFTFPFAGPQAAWHDLLIGAGGLNSGMDISNDGTIVVRTDTYGAYVVNPSDTSLRQLVTTSTVSPSALSTEASGFPTLGAGVYAVAVAPSNSSRVYMYYLNHVFVSNDKGLSFNMTGFGPFGGTSDANANDAKTVGPKMRVDPNNPDKCYVGTPSNGVYVTTNAGSTWTVVSAVGTATNTLGGIGGGHAIDFDPTSSHPGNVTQGIFIFTNGVGLYHSTNGGTSWTLLNTTGMPTTVNNMKCSPLGTVFVINYTVISRWNAGTWLNITPVGGPTLGPVAIDPNNTSRVFVSEWTKSFWVSTDGGATFYTTAVGSTPGTSVRSIPAGEPGWMGVTNWGIISGNMYFDPLVSGRLWVTDGIGFWYIDSPSIVPVTNDNTSSTISIPTVFPTTRTFAVDTGLTISAGQIISINKDNLPDTWNMLGTCLSYNSGTGALSVSITSATGSGIQQGLVIFVANTWKCRSAGEEQLVSSSVVHPPGGYPICVSWDRAIFTLTDLKQYPAVQRWDNSGSIVRGFHADYCWNTPSFVAAVVDASRSAYSTDKGLTWTVFPGQPANGGGGAVAVDCTDTTKMLMFPGNNGDPVRTTNTGTTWSSLASYFSTNFSIPVSPAETGWGNFAISKAVVSDRNTTGKFLAFNYGPSGHTGVAGVYQTLDFGATWTRVRTGNFDGVGFDQFHPVMLSVPNKSGLFFYISGADGANPPNAALSLWRSTNGGSTWAAVTNVGETWNICSSGITESGGTCPTVYVEGYVNLGAGLTYGVYKSKNADQTTPTWTSIGAFPNGWLDGSGAGVMDASKDVIDQFYIGYAGSGYKRYGI